MKSNRLIKNALAVAQSSLEHDDVFFTEEGYIETNIQQVTTEDDVNDAVAAVATLNQAMGALSSTKQILEDSIKQGGVHSDAVPAIGLVMQVAENAGIEPAAITTPAMESFGITDTRINATNIALESLSATISNGAKKLWEKLLELFKKLKDFALNLFKRDVSKSQSTQLLKEIEKMDDDFIIHVELDDKFKDDLIAGLKASSKVKEDSVFKSELEKLATLLETKTEEMPQSHLRDNIEEAIDKIYAQVGDGHKSKLSGFTISKGSTDYTAVIEYLKMDVVNYTVVTKIMDVAIRIAEAKVKGNGDYLIYSDTLTQVRLLAKRLIDLSQSSKVIKRVYKKGSTDSKKIDGISTESDIPEFDMESLMDTVKNVTNRAYTKLIEMLTKLLDFFKTNSVVRKERISKIQQQLIGGSLVTIRTPVKDMNLQVAFTFPMELNKCIKTHLHTFINTIHNYVNKSEDEKLVIDANNAIESLLKDVDGLVSKYCKQKLDINNPRMDSSWVSLNQYRVNSNQVGTIKNNIKSIEESTLQIHRDLDALRTILRFWAKVEEDNGPSEVTITVGKVVSITRSILTMTNPTAILVKIENENQDQNIENGSLERLV